MGNLFGRRRPPPQPPVSQQDQAILQLKTQRDKIKQFMRRNEKQMEREKELARELIRAGKKERALLLLKKKRFQETVIERTLKQLDQIDRMVHDLEFAEIERRVVDGLRNGNEALKEIQKMFSISDIEKIMDETREAAEYQEEISNLISGKLSENDLEEVESEFAALMEGEGVRLNLPEVPTEPLPEPANEKRQKLRNPRDRVALASD